MTDGLHAADALDVGQDERRVSAGEWPGSDERMVSRRIVVVGSTGSGKTTLASQLAARLGTRHIELDALHWEPEWTPATRDVFRSRVDAAVASDDWVADGNYSAVRDLLWARADTLIWLDYALPVILARLTRRTLARIVNRQELWNGNRERFANAFLSRESIFLWLLGSYRRLRREYPLLLSQPEYAHLSVVRLRSPREAAAWLKWPHLVDA